MKKHLMYNFDKIFEYTNSREAQLRPNGQPMLVSGTATPVPPSSEKKDGFTQVWRAQDWTEWPYDEIMQSLEIAAQGDTGAWYWIADHRQKKDEQDRVVEGTGTQYWLPEDTWQSPPRYTNALGPLPENSLPDKPDKPLAVAQEEKRREINSLHERAYAGSVSLSDPSPTAVSVEAALYAQFDPDSLEWLRNNLEARRAELLELVNSKESVSEVEQISVSYLV